MSRRRHKYNARKVERDGHTFDSGAEARRYNELRLLEQAGQIEGLQVHPVYEIIPRLRDPWTGKTLRAIKYEADFAYCEDGRAIVEDVKGVQTRVFGIKWRLFLLRYSEIELRIIKAG